MVIDAGSVHTTLQLYQYPTQHLYNSTIGNVDQVLSCEISGDIGISSLSRPEYVKDLIYSGNCWDKVSNYTNDDFKVKFVKMKEDLLCVVDDRSIGLPMLRPMEPSVFSKPSADGFHLKNIDFPKKWQKETSFEKIFEKVKTV